MRLQSRLVFSIGLFLAALTLQATAQDSNPALTGNFLSKPSAQKKAAVVDSYDKLPLSFEINRGQADPQVRFVSRGMGYSLFLTDSSAVLALTGSDSTKQASGSKGSRAARAQDAKAGKTDVIRMELARTPQNPAPQAPKISGSDLLDGTTNYFVGNDPANWHTSVATYGKVKYTGVYPGVDLVYYGNQRRLEYDFVVAPGFDPAVIRFQFSGTRKMKLDDDGNLILTAGHHRVVFDKPVVYQETASGREPVASRFKLRAKNSIGFSLGSYDRNKPLVIDPTLAYSTLLGGGGPPQATGGESSAIAVDSAGNVYVVGTTSVADFPTTSSAYQAKLNGLEIDNNLLYSFVTKLDPTGSKVIYSTYLTGIHSGLASNGDSNVTSPGDSIYSIFVDSSGDAYLAGATNSYDFPVTTGAYQTVINSGFANDGYPNGFIIKLNATGSALIYSTYLGGSFADYCSQIVVDASGNAYIVGAASSPDFPHTTNAFQPQNNSNYAINAYNAFVTKLSADGSSLIYSTFLGGSARDYGQAIAIDSEGNAYVTGRAGSTDFPTLNPFQSINYSEASQGEPTGFVTKLNSSGTALVYSTYLGGTGANLGFQVNPVASDNPTAIVVDSAGDAYVTGVTFSQDFPLKNPYQSTNKTYTNRLASVNSTGFVTKFDPTGAALVFSTYLGSSGGEFAASGQGNMALDSKDNIYFTGTTAGYDYPVTSTAFQSLNRTTQYYSNGTAYRAYDNAFLTELSSDGQQLLYATYLGGSGFGSAYDTGASLALDSSGNAYVAGTAGSNDFPTTAGAYQTTKFTEYDAFVAKFTFGSPSNKTLTTIKSNANPQNTGTSVTFTSYVASTSGTGIPTGTITFSVDGAASSPVTLNQAGYATYTPPSLSDGDHTIVASYSGDKNYAASSAVLTQAVVGAPASIAVVSGSGQSTYLYTPLANLIVLVVKDANGTPVPNVPVYLSGFALYYIYTGYVDAGTFSTDATTGFDGTVSFTVYPASTGNLVGTAKVSGVNTPAFFTVNALSPIAATPTFSVLPGTYTTVQQVSLADTTPGATIHYTTDGTTPTTSSTLYVGNPITVSKTETIKAIAVASNYANSAVATAQYTINLPTAATPVFSPPQGTFLSAQEVTITDSTPQATIYYTTDGTTPTTSSHRYYDPIYVSLSETIKAIAVANNYSNSLVATGAYVITTTLPPPTFNPSPGNYNVSQSVTISDAIAGRIHLLHHRRKHCHDFCHSVHRAHFRRFERDDSGNRGVRRQASSVSSASYNVTAPFSFVPVTPCRVVDTRNANGSFGGPEMSAGQTRAFNIPQSACGIPSNAAAYSLNVTVLPSKTLGYLTIWPTGQNQPNVSTLNSPDGRIKANAAIVPAGTNGAVSVYVTDATQVILDIDGYFLPAGSSGGLAFYPLTPCRIADTRNAAGSLGGPSINGGASRAFPILSSNCNVPTTAKAYSLNFTAVPHSTLNYLTTWPTGEAQPNVSTLNAGTGAVTANAAIVPAGTSGDVSVFVSDTSDVILDINGYFAPPGSGGLSLYTVAPCRVIDTRPTAFNGVLPVNVEGSACAPPSGAEAYVFNATVVPPGALDYLTLWPAGENQPYVSTLNALDGVITSNMAIVPTNNGSIDAFASDSTNLILDISSYFAP